MPSDLTSPPSAAELAQLKQAFSKDPFSEAYHPLAEAYLLSNSYMEAMVVCKKGIKAFPGKAEPHILMARIYAAQKKDAKALDEVKQALERDDSNVDALLLASELSYKSGNSGDGADYLKKAQSLEPGREDVQAACQRRGIQPQSRNGMAVTSLEPKTGKHPVLDAEGRVVGAESILAAEGASKTAKSAGIPGRPQETPLWMELSLSQQTLGAKGDVRNTVRRLIRHLAPNMDPRPPVPALPPPDASSDVRTAVPWAQQQKSPCGANPPARPHR